MGYAVSTPVFEGPFDLLLHLILREQVELFTGHTMFLTFGVKTGKITMADLLRILPQTWAGNLLGSVVVALIYFALCFPLSWWSKWLELRLAVAGR